MRLSTFCGLHRDTEQQAWRGSNPNSLRNALQEGSLASRKYLHKTDCTFANTFLWCISVTTRPPPLIPAQAGQAVLLGIYVFYAAWHRQALIIMHVYRIIIICSQIVQQYIVTSYVWMLLWHMLVAVHALYCPYHAVIISEWICYVLLYGVWYMS